METMMRFLKSPLLHGTLVGAFGGMAPTLVKLLPKFSTGSLPSTGEWWAVGILALFGAVIVLVHKEVNLYKALSLGAGAPAIIGALAGQTVAPTDGWIDPFRFSIVSVAYANDPWQDPASQVKIVVQENQSKTRTDALWLRADDSTLAKYSTIGDTILVRVPRGAKTLRIGLPGSSGDLNVPLSEIDTSRMMRIRIGKQEEVSDFWRTFSGKSVPKLNVEQVKQKK